MLFARINLRSSMSFYHLVSILFFLFFASSAAAAVEVEKEVWIQDSLQNENEIITTAGDEEETEEEEDDPSLPHVEPPPGKQGNETGSYDQVYKKILQ